MSQSQRHPSPRRIEETLLTLVGVLCAVLVVLAPALLLLAALI